MSVRQAPCGQGQDHLVDAAQTPLALLDDLWLEAAGAVTRHRDLDGADVGQHGLGADAVAGVPAAGTGRIVLVIAKVVGDFALQSGLQHALGQLLEETTFAGQLEPARAGPVDQLPNQLVVQQIRRQLDRPNLFNRLDRDSHVAHQVLLP